MAGQSSLIYDYASSSEVLAAGITLSVLGTIAVALRFIARLRAGASVGKDDTTILLALICVIGMSVILIYGNVKGAIGYPTPKSSSFDPQQNSEPAVVALTFQLAYFFWLPTTLAFGFVRLGVLFFYRRLFLVHSKSLFDIVSLVLICVVVLWTIVFVCLLMFYCGLHFPLSGSIEGCLPITTIFVAYTASDIALDVFIWILPLPIIWKLRTSKTRKLLVTSIFLLASISLVAAPIRFVVQIEDYTQDPLGVGNPVKGADIDQIVTITLYWSLIQAGIALIASCLPTIHSLVSLESVRSLVKRVKRSLHDSLGTPRLWKSTRGSGHTSFAMITTDEDLSKPSRPRVPHASTSDLEMLRIVPSAEERTRTPRLNAMPESDYDWGFVDMSGVREGTAPTGHAFTR